MAGLTRAGAWRADRVAEIARRREWVGSALADRPGGFEIAALGGFFAWVRHPFPDRPTLDVVRTLLLDHDTLTIPGTAFLPDDRQMLRLSVGRVDEASAALLAERLTEAGRRAGWPPGHSTIGVGDTEETRASRCSADHGHRTAYRHRGRPLGHHGLRARLGHGDARQHRRHDRAAPHRRGPRRRFRGAAVDGQRLHPDPGRADPARRLAG